MFVDHYVVQADSWVGSVFQTTVGSTVVFKDELPAATEKKGASNWAGPLSEEYTVQVQSLIG